MTAISNLQLPYNYGLQLPHKPRTLHWLGRTVEWIRRAESRGVFRKVLIYTLTFFTSILLCLSLVGLPFFVLGFKEFMIQKERSRYDQQVNHLIQIAKENERTAYLMGRAAAAG